MFCKSGKHFWSRAEDASRCCNGYKRILVLGDIREAETVGHGALPGPTLYGFQWMKVELEPAEPEEVR